MKTFSGFLTTCTCKVGPDRYRLDNLIQPYPEFRSVPTLVHPKVGDNNLLSEVVLLH